MKNRLTDLNDILFAQLERLTDESLSAEAITRETDRTRSVVQVADRIVENARLQLQAATLVVQQGAGVRKQLPTTLGLPSGDAAEVRP